MVAPQKNSMLPIKFLLSNNRIELFHLSNIELHVERFYFLLPISRESIVLGTNFRNGYFDGFTRFEVS